MRQVLLNLVNNAIKFTEKGGVGIQVMVKVGHAELPGQPVPIHFEVKDTGVGLAESRLYDEHGVIGRAMQTLLVEPVGRRAPIGSTERADET